MRRRIMWSALILGVLVALGLTYYGATTFDIGALQQPGKWETYLFTKAKQWLVARSARSVMALPPGAITDVANGQFLFAGCCGAAAGCCGTGAQDGGAAPGCGESGGGDAASGCSVSSGAAAASANVVAGRSYVSSPVLTATALSVRNSSLHVPASEPNGSSTGLNCCSGSCAMCHGSSGRTPTVLGRSFYPPAPDLGSPVVQQYSDAGLFVVIKRGIRNTGMPGFGNIHSDEELWDLVSYVRSLGAPSQGQPAPAAQQHSE